MYTSERPPRQYAWRWCLLSPEFGFSERSYHCKHGAFTAAAVALAFQSRLPLASVIARSDLSVYALRYSTKRSDDLASLPMHDFTFFPFTHSVPIFVLSKAALTQRRRTTQSTGKLLDHHRECIQHPNSDCQTRRDSISSAQVQLHLEYRTDGSAAQAQLARTLA